MDCGNPAVDPSRAAMSLEMHMDILQTHVELATERSGQQPRRELEQRVRQRAADFATQLVEHGFSHDEAAQRLGVCERTLRQWEQDVRADLEAAAPRGRPAADSGPAQQQVVLGWLNEVGPGVGVPTLRAQFPGMARAELTDLVQCYRDLWRAHHARLLHVLHWQRPGTVWAMDFAETPSWIDDQYPYLLAVRDLASGRQLLWRPVLAPTAEVVIAELTPLFMTCGAPWVLKSDNGSAFIAEQTRNFLGRWQAFTLFSPPHTPSYNGSIEASIGSLKTRTQRLATLAGHPQLWTTADVEAARQQANATARPRRLHGATPDEVWYSRTPLTADERTRFRATVQQFQDDVRWEKHLPLVEELSRTTQAAVDRVAIPRALVAHDLLLFRRRKISAPITRPKAAMKG